MANLVRAVALRDTTVNYRKVNRGETFVVPDYTFRQMADQGIAKLAVDTKRATPAAIAKPETATKEPGDGEESTETKPAAGGRGRPRS